MIAVSIEGVRRNFSISSVFMYSVTLVDESGQRVFTFHIERCLLARCMAGLECERLVRLPDL